MYFKSLEEVANDAKRSKARVQQQLQSDVKHMNKVLNEEKRMISQDEEETSKPFSAPLEKLTKSDLDDLTLFALSKRLAQHTLQIDALIKSHTIYTQQLSALDQDIKDTHKLLWDQREHH